MVTMSSVSPATSSALINSLAQPATADLAFATGGLGNGATSTQPSIPPFDMELVDKHVGTSGDDVFTGSWLIDIFEGQGGHDRFDGGSNIDSAVFARSYKDYSLVHDRLADEVSSKSLPGDVANMKSVERLQFADAVVVLSESGATNHEQTSSNFAMVEKLYLAYFGRPADHFGLIAMGNQLSTLNAPVGSVAELLAAVGTNAGLKSLLDSFSSASEGLKFNAFIDSKSLVASIYQHLFGREPDIGGLDYWSKAIDNGHVAWSTAALHIMAGAEEGVSAQGQVDAQVLHNRVLAAINFNLALDTPAEIYGYAGWTAEDLGRSLINSVNQNTNTLAFESTIQDLVARLGGTPVPTVHSAEAPAPVELAGHAPVELVGQALVGWPA